MANTWDVGDLIRCTGTFTDSAGAAVDPANVFVKIKDPSRNVDTYQYGVDSELVKSGTGVYYTDVDVDERGTWAYRWYSTGTGQAAGENTFKARESLF